MPERDRDGSRLVADIADLRRAGITDAEERLAVRVRARIAERHPDAT